MLNLDQRFKGNEQIDLLIAEAGLNGAKRKERYPNHRFYGFFCSYLPEELVLAAGIQPLRLFPHFTQAAPAELPAYCCSLAKGTLSLAKPGNYNDLAGYGFVHTCDVMQCLGGIWKDVVSREKTYMLVPPVMLNAAGAAKYFRIEAENLLAALGKLTNSNPGGSEIAAALKLCRQVRQLAGELDQLRPMLPSQLVSALLRAGQVMPREDYLSALQKALPVLKQRTDKASFRKKLLVTGAVLENDSLFTMVEELGGRIVADDICTGFRHFVEPPVNDDPENIMQTVINRYLEMPPCPCRNRGLDARLNYLVSLARERGASAAIILIRKYCDPHAWDAVPLAKCLRDAGIQVLVMELEGADVGGQERTRLQAFIESL